MQFACVSNLKYNHLSLKMLALFNHYTKFQKQWYPAINIGKIYNTQIRKKESFKLRFLILCLTQKIYRKFLHKEVSKTFQRKCEKKEKIFFQNLKKEKKTHVKMSLEKKKRNKEDGKKYIKRNKMTETLKQDIFLFKRRNRQRDYFKVF